LATKIRLKRLGGKHDPHFRIVVVDGRDRRDGKAIEELGHYNPTKEPVLLKVDHERALYWLGVGAQPSETVRSLLRQEGVLAQAAATARGQRRQQSEPAPAAAEAADQAEQAGAEAESGDAEDTV